jgi:hypothetical protein
MPPGVRQFYARYYFLTTILPAYVMALFFYGTAWLLCPASPLANLPAIPGVFLAGIVLFAGVSRLLSLLGFYLSGIPAARVQGTPDDYRKLAEAMEWEYGASDSTAMPREDFEPIELQPILVDLGDVPYLAQGGLSPGYLWISTHTLRNTETRILRHMVTHEQGHAAARGKGCSWPWYDLFWTVAYPLAFAFSALGMPELIAAAGLVHALLWLRFNSYLTLRDEVKADQWAAQRAGQESYAGSLVKYLAKVHGADPRLVRYRLRRLGLPAEQTEQLLKNAAKPDGC